MKALVMGKSKHRRPNLWERLTQRQATAPRVRTIAWVDLRTNLTHLLTPDAAAAGRVPGGRYIALCGLEMIPAAMTDPGHGHCQLCHDAAIPTQRSRNTSR